MDVPHLALLTRLLLGGVLACAAVSLQAQAPLRQAAPQDPVFRTAIDLVPVSAVVRDDRGRSLRDLQRDEFLILERGRPRPIVDFKVSDQGPVSLAVLMDTSGSMRVGRQLEASREAVEHLLSWVQPAADEIGLFSFDRELRHDVPFTKDLDRIRDGVARLDGMGLTSLYRRRLP